MDFLFNTIGIIGMSCFLVAYFFLQRDSWKPHGFPYLAINLLGSILLLISLTWSWNLASFLLEVCWASISGYGLIKYYRKKSHQAPACAGDEGGL